MDYTKIAFQKLSNIPLFSGMALEEVREILKRANAIVRHFPKSDYIYLAGDCVENICVIISGTVQIIKEDIWGDRSIIVNMGAGSVFAENFLGRRSGQRSIVSYFVASDSEILMLPLGNMFLEGVGGALYNSRLLSNFVGVLADNNTRLLEKNDVLCKKSLRAKILTYLEQEAHQQGSREVQLPFNRTDLANYLDADRSALTRELARMRDDGLLTFEKNVFLLPDKDFLA